MSKTDKIPTGCLDYKKHGLPFKFPEHSALDYRATLQTITRRLGNGPKKQKITL